MVLPYQPMLVYPVTGAGTLWTSGPPPAPGALAALLGRTRAQILTALADPATHRAARAKFLLLKQGGYRGRLFEPSLLHLEDLPKGHGKFVARGRAILKRTDRWQLFYRQ